MKDAFKRMFPICLFWLLHKLNVCQKHGRYCPPPPILLDNLRLWLNVLQIRIWTFSDSRDRQSPIAISSISCSCRQIAVHCTSRTRGSDWCCHLRRFVIAVIIEVRLVDLIYGEYAAGLLSLWDIRNGGFVKKVNNFISLKISITTITHFLMNER